MRLHCRVACHRKRIGIFARKAVARRVCPLHEVIPFFIACLCRDFRPVRMAAAARRYRAVHGGQTHEVAVYGKMRLHCRVACHRKRIGIFARKAVARRRCPLHEVIPFVRLCRCRDFRPVRMDAFHVRCYRAVHGGQAHAVAVYGKMRPHCRVAFHRKRIGIFARKAVARRVCPLRKMIALVPVRRQRRLCSVGKLLLFVAAYASQLPVVYFGGYRIIIGGNRETLPTVARRPVSDKSVPFFRTFGNMNLAGSRHFGKSLVSNSGYRVDRKRQGS
ncbi:hypothetical protein Barb4_04445 [Bacteroidales bacterium Barb4]|nr:hypothetical protein Barb4_04445 [Bacteroidales bacterium Barb4]